jgi:HK97 family phage major capsid protein
MIPLAQILGESLGMRVARAQEQKFLNGTGTGEPQGIITGATAGGTTAAAGALTISDLLTLYYSVDPAYRESPSAAFIVSDQTLMALHNTRLGAPGDPALVQDFRDPKAPMKLFGRNIIVSSSMPSGSATGTTAAVFGDLGLFIIRDVAGIELKVTEHLYWANNQIGYLAEAFSDSRVMIPEAIKKLAYK